MDYFSSYSCGSVRVELSLPESIGNYQPRKCDCDFCLPHKLAYISDPLGKLSVKSSVSIKYLKQGSEQASFMQCSHCNQVVAVIYNTNQVQKGAVSSVLFANYYSLGEYQPISPKLLSSLEKRVRWETLWMPLLLELGTGT